MDTINQLSRLQFKTVKQSFVHGDLYSRHIIVDPVSLLPTGVIDWGDIHIGHPAIDLASGMVLTERVFKIFLDTYGSIDEESRAIMGFHAFCHGMSFLPYAFEQDKDDLKRWATLVLARCQTASKIDPLSAPKIDPPLPFKLNSGWLKSTEHLVCFF